MKFETVFNLGDRVWFMKDNNPTEAVISAVQIFHVGNNQDSVQYNAKKVVGSVSWLDYQHLHEPSLFASKAELIYSLIHGQVICKGEKCKAINGRGHSAECLANHEKLAAAETHAILATPQPAEPDTHEAFYVVSPNVSEMVNRFLGWTLPRDFSPDCGIVFNREVNIPVDGELVKMDRYDAPGGFKPVGTNLFTADQAKAMIEYLLTTPPTSEAQTNDE